MNQPMFIVGERILDFTIGGEKRKAIYVEGDQSEYIVFSYSVTEQDEGIIKVLSTFEGFTVENRYNVALMKDGSIEVGRVLTEVEVAEAAVEAAETASQAGVAKKTEVTADGLVSAADKVAVDELNEVTEAKTLNASMLELPKTGSVDNSILKVTGGVLFLGSLGLLGYKKRRENNR